MWHGFSADAKLCAQLFDFDLQIAAAVKAAGCPACRARLDRADYPRKPRGGAIAAPAEEWTRRLSLCCSREGCRRRSTPPSVRFLGRKVYVAASTVIAPIVFDELGGAADACAATGVPPRTVRRWRSWWTTAFARSSFFSAARGLLRTPIHESKMPLSLLDSFAGDSCRRLRLFLRFVSPVTTSSVADGSRFLMGIS